MKKRTKNNIKKAFGVWGRVVSSTVLCAFLYFTSLMVVNMAFVPEVGYRITKADANGGVIEVERYLYKDGEDASMTVELEEGETRIPIRGELSGTVTTVYNIAILAIMLIMVGVFPYNVLWKLGANDENKVKFGRKQKDILRGLKIGAIATAPSLLAYILLILAKCGLIPGAYIVIFRAINLPYLPFVNLMTGSTMSAVEIPWLGLLGLIITLLFVPAVCTIGYVLGYRNFSVHEALVYRKPSESDDEEI